MNMSSKCQWSSGRIAPCHGADPGSIPGWHTPFECSYLGLFGLHLRAKLKTSKDPTQTRCTKSQIFWVVSDKLAEGKVHMEVQTTLGRSWFA